jgi:hypothetical protein
VNSLAHYTLDEVQHSNKDTFGILSENEFPEKAIDITKCECNSLSLCSLDQRIHYFLINPCLLRLMNSLKI